MIKHFQSTQGNKFVIYLQYRKNEVTNRVYFLYTYKHRSFCKLTLSFLMEVASYIQSTQNRKFVVFLQFIKEEVLQPLLHSVVMQNIQIFYGGSVSCCFFKKYFITIVFPILPSLKKICGLIHKIFVFSIFCSFCFFSKWFFIELVSSGLS